MGRRTRSHIHLRVVRSQDSGVLTTCDWYTELADRHLSAVLAAEDTAERFGMGPHARSTCQVHQCWIHECVADPAHISPATGHRWCRRCELPIDVEVTAGEVRLRCAGCGAEADSAANREIVRTCRMSLGVMSAFMSAALYAVPDCDDPDHRVGQRSHVQREHRKLAAELGSPEPRYLSVPT
jgi:hypothetical protein